MTDAQLDRLKVAGRSVGTRLGRLRLSAAVAELDLLSERGVPFVTGRLASDRWSS